MTQTGTGLGRVKKVFRRRITDLWNVSPIWWPEDTTFTPTGDVLMRVIWGRFFGLPWAVGGGSVGTGSVSLVFGVKSGPGMDAAKEAAEAQARDIGKPTENDHAEAVWTLSGIEVVDNVQPSRIPGEFARAFSWIQFVISFTLEEPI